MKANTLTSLNARTSSKAFTLIETAISSGIVATVLMALIALIPLGVNQLSESAAAATHARIVQSISSLYRLMDWDTATDPNNDETDFYFDHAGAHLADATGNEPEIHWIARSSVENAPALPGASGSNPYARSIEIALSSHVTAPDPFSDDLPLSNYATTISKFDK